MTREAEKLCPRYQAAMAILGKRWTGLVVSVLLRGPLRFSEMAQVLDVVSDRMLSARLKELEAEGLVTRRVLPDPPVRVEYQLTKKGRALAGVVSSVEKWAQRWVEPVKVRASKRRR
jgi:DNA-binding HxlR family transcriptional regulator